MTVTDRILKKWISNSAIQNCCRKNIVWNTDELWAKEASMSTSGTDEGLEFLDGFGDDPMDVYDGTLEFDLEMSDTKNIDNGATVAGALDKLRKKDSQLEDAFLEIEVKDSVLENEVFTELNESNGLKWSTNTMFNKCV
jgi:hypothetical protein